MNLLMFQSLECQNIVKILCDITPDKSWDIKRGETRINNQILSILVSVYG
jgi:hypothetical protein